jgi:hypothetical protein
LAHPDEAVPLNALKVFATMAETRNAFWVREPRIVDVHATDGAADVTIEPSVGVVTRTAGGCDTVNRTGLENGPWTSSESHNATVHCKGMSSRVLERVSVAELILDVILPVSWTVVPVSVRTRTIRYAD